MSSLLESLLSEVASPQACLAWFNQNAPIQDDQVVNALREEANRRLLSLPASGLEISQLLSLAAEIWHDPPTQAVAWLVEANTYSKLGEHGRALQLYERTIQSYQSLGQELSAARATVGQIDTLLYLGHYEQALAIAKWSTEVLRHANDKVTLGKILSNRGNILARLGEYAAAHDCYQNARALFEELGDRNAQAIVAVNDANVLTELNDFYNAEQMLTSAYAYFAQAGLVSAAAQILHNLAYLFFCQGDYRRALSDFAKARKIFTEQKSEIDIAYVDLYRTEIYLALNLWQEVIDVASATQPLFVKAGMHWEAARLWLNESIAFHHIGDYASAHRAITHAGDFFAEQRNDYWLAVCQLYLATFEMREGLWSNARRMATQALTAFDINSIHTQAAKCEVLLGEIALQQLEVEDANHYFLCALKRISAARLPAIRFLCHWGLGKIKQIQNDYNRAYYHLRSAVDDLELLAMGIGAEDYKIAFRSDKLHVYEAFTRLCLDLGTPAQLIEALTTIEQAKSRVLSDSLHARQSWHKQRSQTLSQNAELEDLRRQLHWRYSRLYTPQPDAPTLSSELVDHLTHEISQFESELMQKLKAIRLNERESTPMERASVITVEQIQAILPERGLLLEYFVVPNEIIVIGVSRGNLWSRRIPVAKAQLSRLIEQMQMQIAKFRFGAGYIQRHAEQLLDSLQDNLRSLYDLLLQPIEDLVDADILFIAPHDLLHYVPFSALCKDQTPLIQSESIVLTPSATLLHHLLNTQPLSDYTPPLLIGVGDELAPFALAEAEALHTIFPEAMLCVGEDATLKHILNSSLHPAFLHLATHAVFRADNPFFSAIKLNDGWLDVNEIEFYGLSAPLITLSACETGLHYIAAGDELLGLCRGFFSAGTTSMIVSLWPVDDSITKELMLRFYTLWQSGFSLHQALRNAQNEIRQEWPHPYYWAPFVLIGNPFLQFAQDQVKALKFSELAE